MVSKFTNVHIFPLWKKRNSFFRCKHIFKDSSTGAALDCQLLLFFFGRKSLFRYKNYVLCHFLIFIAANRTMFKNQNQKVVSPCFTKCFFSSKKFPFEPFPSKLTPRIHPCIPHTLHFWNLVKKVMLPLYIPCFMLPLEAVYHMFDSSLRIFSCLWLKNIGV